MRQVRHNAFLRQPRKRNGPAQARAAMSGQEATERVPMTDFLELRCARVKNWLRASPFPGARFVDELACVLSVLLAILVAHLVGPGIFPGRPFPATWSCAATSRTASCAARCGYWERSWALDWRFLSFPPLDRPGRWSRWLPGARPAGDTPFA